MNHVKFFDTYIPEKRDCSGTGKQVRDEILDFKRCRNEAMEMAASKVAFFIASSVKDCHDCTFICIPSSSQKEYVRRFKHFGELVCSWAGCQDGFPLVRVIKDKKPMHFRSRRVPNNEINYVLDEKIKGKRVIIFDDIIREGNTLTNFCRELNSAGGKFAYAIFLGRCI